MVGGERWWLTSNPHVTPEQAEAVIRAELSAEDLKAVGIDAVGEHRR